MMKLSLFSKNFIPLLLAPVALFAADANQFRGPNRDGHFSETGLLKRWPQGGPKLLWHYVGLGSGYSSATEADGLIYATGMSGQQGFVFAFDSAGKLKWKKAYGQEANGGGYPGARTTPTIDDGLVYVISSAGRVVCLDAKTGADQWAVDAMRQFSGKQIQWSITESLLIDGNKVICTPGGIDASLAALDKKTGKTIWTSKGLSDASGYCSPTLVKRGNRRIIVTLTAKLIVGVDAENGKVLWRQGHPTSYDVHAVTPVHSDGMVYASAGYGSGGMMLQLSPDGSGVTAQWRDQTLDCHHQGVVLADGHIYGTSHKSPSMVCLELKTGKVMWVEKGPGQAGLASADGMIYAYGNRQGEVYLIEANPKRYVPISSFRVPYGDGQHWAHPTLSNGRLYLRHGNALMAYDIKAPAKQ